MGRALGEGQPWGGIYLLVPAEPGSLLITFVQPQYDSSSFFLLFDDESDEEEEEELMDEDEEEEDDSEISGYGGVPL